MSTRIVRSIKDFSRHRMAIDVVCSCGHTASLDFVPVVAKFVAKGWPVDLQSALGRFRCTKCGGAARSIGPMPR